VREAQAPVRGLSDRQLLRLGAPGFAAPDPADGTAGTTKRQSVFAGSDRQGRGRLVQALRTGPVEIGRVADVTGWPEEPDRARRVADALVGEGLAEYVDGQLSLPASTP
jgi:A/G-specific adenine glycosylase